MYNVYTTLCFIAYEIYVLMVFRSGRNLFQKSWKCNKTLTIKFYPHFETKLSPADSAFSVFLKVTTYTKEVSSKRELIVCLPKYIQS